MVRCWHPLLEEGEKERDYGRGGKFSSQEDLKTLMNVHKGGKRVEGEVWMDPEISKGGLAQGAEIMFTIPEAVLCPPQGNQGRDGGWSLIIPCVSKYSSL